MSNLSDFNQKHAAVVTWNLAYYSVRLKTSCRICHMRKSQQRLLKNKEALCVLEISFRMLTQPRTLGIFLQLLTNLHSQKALSCLDAVIYRFCFQSQLWTSARRLRQIDQ